MTPRNYELSFWFSSNIQENEVELLFQDLLKTVESINAEIITSQLPQLKSLAYPIKKETNGYFGYIQFKGEDLNLNELKQKLLNNNTILRYLLVKFEGQERARKEKPLIHKEKTSSQELKSFKATSEKKNTKISLEELDKKLSELLKEE
jgi:small subunit ribosomal protein S6